MVELHRQDTKWATGEANFGYWTRPGRWTNLGSLKLSLSTRDYDALSADIDALLARGDPPLQPPGSDYIVVCTDGPGYLTERRVNGKSTWLEGLCGDHPNKAIAKLMQRVVWHEACKYKPTVVPCDAATAP